MQDGKKQLINYHAYVSHNKIEFSKMIPRGIKKLILRYFGVNFVTSQPVKSADVLAPTLCACWVARHVSRVVKHSLTDVNLFLCIQKNIDLIRNQITIHHI